MENKKYELTNETMEYGGYTLHRIKALKSFEDVKEGDLGGWIETEDNLSQEGNCWIYDNAKVSDNAIVFGNARVCCNARVCGNASIFGMAMIFDDAEVYNKAKVCDNIKVSGDVVVNSGIELASKNKEVCISNNDQFKSIDNIGSRNSTTTFFKDIYTNIIYVVCGCFRGTIDEFKERVIETHGDNKYAEQYLGAIEYIKKIL